MLQRSRTAAGPWRDRAAVCAGRPFLRRASGSAFCAGASRSDRRRGAHRCERPRCVATRIRRMAEDARAQQRRAWAQPIAGGVDGRAGAALASDIRSLGDTPLVVLTAARDRELTLPGSPAEDLSAMAPTEAGDADRVGRTLDRPRPRPRVAQPPLHLPRPAARRPSCDPRLVRTVREKAPLPPCEQVFTGSGRPLSQLAPPPAPDPQATPTPRGDCAKPLTAYLNEHMRKRHAHRGGWRFSRNATVADRGVTAAFPPESHHRRCSQSGR